MQTEAGLFARFAVRGPAGLEKTMSATIRSGARLLIVGAGVLAALAGCNNGPAGKAPGHVNPYQHSEASDRDPAVNEITLLEFADQVTAAMAQRIPTIPDIKDSPRKVVIAVGDVTNRTNTPSNDFAAIRSQIFTDLVNSNVTKYADILETLEIMQAQMARYSTDNRDAARYNPEQMYILNGEFSEISRGEGGKASVYIFNWRLVNLATSKTVFADRLTAKQQRP